MCILFASPQEYANFDDCVSGLTGDVHMLSPDTDDGEPQLFIIVENEVLMEVNEYKHGVFALLGVHYVFNLEYPKK